MNLKQLKVRQSIQFYLNFILTEYLDQLTLVRQSTLRRLIIKEKKLREIRMANHNKWDLTSSSFESYWLKIFQLKGAPLSQKSRHLLP